MKERLLEIIKLAYEVNDLLGMTFVSVDISRYDAIVNIHVLSKNFKSEKRETYWSPTQYADAPYMDEWIIDPGLVHAEKALRAILEKGRAA